MFSRYSVKKPYTVIVGIILVIVLGYISFQHMTTDLLPSMNLPYVVVYTSYVGATPEQVEADLTRPMEAAFATLNDVKKITSQSRDNVSVVIMQFNDGANMDTALIEISSRLDQLRGDWSDDVGAPVTMKLNPDMLPVAILSVTRDDMDILALSNYVEDELVPAFEALNGVASAEASGVIQQRIDVTIEQSRIDVLNEAILKDVNKELSDVEKKLNDAQAQLSDGKGKLSRAKKKAMKQLDDAEAALDKAEAQIKPAIEQLTQQRADAVAQREALAKNVAALEALVNMDEDQRQQLRQIAEALAQLKLQRQNLAEQLALAEAALADPALAEARAELQSQRDALDVERAAQQQYLDDLKLLDADALRQEIEALDRQIADDEAALETARADLADLEARQAEARKNIDDLTRQIEGTGDKTVEKGETPAETEAPAGAAEAPAATEAPAETEIPADADTASEATIAPAQTEAPEETEPHADTDTSSGSAGAATDAPVQTESPKETDAPADTDTGSGSASAATDAPPQTEAPKETEPHADTDTGSGSASAATDAPPQTEAPKETEPHADTDTSSGDASAATKAPTQTEAPKQDNADTAAATEGASSAAGDDASTPKPTEKPTPTPSPTPSPSPSPAPESARLIGAALAEEVPVEKLKQQRDAEQARLAELDGQVEAKAAEIEALSKKLEAQKATLAARRDALDTMTDDNADIQSRTEAAQAGIDRLSESIAALDLELAQLDAQQAQLAAAPEALKQGIAQIDERIAAIENSEAYQAILLLEDPEGLNAKYIQATEGLAQLDAGIAQMDEVLAKLKKNIIPGGFVEGMDEDTDLNAARAQLEDGRDQMDSAFSQAAGMLKDAEAELAKARKEFVKQRDEALENAGLDGVITMQTVSGLIGAANIAMPAGYVHDADDEQVLVRVGDKFTSLDGVRRLKLFKLGLDSVDEVRLLDVAKVELTDDRDDVFTKLNGQDGILLSMDKQSTFSTADVAKTVMDKARALAEENPNLHIVDLMNQGEYINIIVDSVLGNLLTGGGLAILILLLFLMDFRPTITVAFSIPISVVIAFVCMYFTGITLNVLSLSGLSLGIGMLVDNSIVAIENIYRLHDEEGVPLLRACVEGVRSVSGALFSSTLTTICVFLPIVFVQGMARDLFADMGLTIAYSLLASLFVAMTVVPAMCSFLMRHSRPHRHRIFGAIQRFYGFLLRGALRFKPLVLLAALGLLAFAAMQVPKMGISFMPEVNSRQMSANLEFDSDMTEAQQKAQAVAIMDGMMQIDGVESVGLMGGGTGILGGGTGMSYYINIDESKQHNNADIARQMEDIGKKLNADLTVQASTMDISMMTGSGIQVEITGDDLQMLQSIATDVAGLARQTEGIADVDDGLEDAVPELRVEVDKEKAADESLTTGQVLQFVAQKVAGRVKITEVTLNGRELDIYLEDGENSKLKPADIEDLEIEVDSNDKNKLVRIGDIATIRDSQSLSTISRSSQRRMVTVSFTVAEGYSANLVSDAFAEKLKGYSLPAGYSAELAGENETVMGIMEDLVWMVLVAVLLIFLIMVAQFQSFKSPIIVMFTIPLAFTGGLLALLATGMDLSIVSMLGFLVLSGVVVNNGIVFIDCVNQLRIGGMEKREALIETGRIRLRPILMTALTTILGMSTMALGQGAGAEMKQPMAVVSIGGLSYATLMTLFIVPALYDLLNGKKMKAREIQMIKEAAGMTGDEVLDGETRAEAEATAPAPTPAPEPKPTAPAPASAEPAIETGAPATGVSAAPEPKPAPASAEPAIETGAPATGVSAAPEPKPATDPVKPVPPTPAKPLRIRLKPGRG